MDEKVLPHKINGDFVFTTKIITSFKTGDNLYTVLTYYTRNFIDNQKHIISNKITFTSSETFLFNQ